jgi:hypothetical protein
VAVSPKAARLGPSSVPLRFASELPPQATPKVPLRVAVATARPFALQVSLRLAALIILQIPFRLTRQNASLLTSEIYPQIATGGALGQTFRTTPGTVPGTVPRASREGSILVRSTATNAKNCSHLSVFGLPKVCEPRHPGRHAVS